MHLVLQHLQVLTNFPGLFHCLQKSIQNVFFNQKDLELNHHSAKCNKQKTKSVYSLFEKIKLQIHSSSPAQLQCQLRGNSGMHFGWAFRWNSVLTVVNPFAKHEHTFLNLEDKAMWRPSSLRWFHPMACTVSMSILTIKNHTKSKSVKC